MSKYFIRVAGASFTKRLIIIVTSLAAINTVQAKDFGKNGHSYQVAEQGFLAMIEERLSKVDPEELRTHMQKVTAERIREPEALEDIERAEESRVFYFDPSYVVEEDIVLPCGQLLHRKGTRVNPLDHMEFDRELYFIDARDKDQVRWIKSKLRLGKNEAANNSNESGERLEKIILTGGSPQRLQEELGRDVYFDQKGELSTQFGIRHVPALVIGEGKFLKIVEEKIDK